MEYFQSNERGDDLLLLAEFDSVDQSYFVSASYLAAIGDFNAGPTTSYIEQGVFSRVAFGATVAFDLTEATELKTTVAWAEDDDGTGGFNDASYLEFVVRTSF